MNVLSCCLLAAVLGLTSCSSSGAKKNEPPKLMSERMATRFTKPDMTRRSIYEKSMQASIGKTDNIGSWFTGKKVHSKEFAGGKRFSGAHDFKTGSFSGSSQKSSMTGQSFAQSGKRTSYADKAFGAGESRYQNQKASEASKMFGTETLETSSNRDALKAQQKNVRPEFVEFEDQKRDPAYTEEQVRKLLGRD